MFKVENNISPVYANRIFGAVDKGYGVIGVHNVDFHIFHFNTRYYGKHSLIYFRS